MKTWAFLVACACAVVCRPGPAVGADFYEETALPVLGLQFSPSNWWSLLQANYQTKTNLVATLTVDGLVYEGVGVRFRGNTSYMMVQNSEKKSFNLEIDYTIAGQRLLGHKTLNLINCANDATFMREVLYSNTCRRQIPSAKANFVRLEINGQNWGVYANVQQLNAQLLNDWFPSNDGTQWRAEGMMGGAAPGGNTGGGAQPPVIRRSTGGDIVVAEQPAGAGMTNGIAALTWQGTNAVSYQVAYEWKNTHQADPWASLIHTCDVLNNTPLAQLPGKLESVLNVDGALWLCAFEIIFQDDDGYVNKRGSDYGLYYEPETGRLHLLQYDGNESLATGQWSIFYRADDTAVPIMNRLMAIPQYRQRYLAHVRTILNSFFTEDELFPKIDAYQALIEQEVKGDTKKLYSNQAFDSGITSLKSFIQGRRSYLLSDREINRQVPQITAVRQEVIQTDFGQTVIVTARLSSTIAVSRVQLFVAAGPFALFETVTMIDTGLDTENGTSEHAFTTILPDYPAGTILRYYVQASAADAVGSLVFDPPGAEHEVYRHVVTYPQAASSRVVINEIMAKNQSTIADPQGQYDDWIELKNVAVQVVDLSGMYLSDDPSDPLQWQFPEGVLLGPGEYLLVWMDEAGDDAPGLHADFKLSTQGETIWLFDAAQNGYSLLDCATFENLARDQSIGRYPDGVGPVRVFAVPSPLGPNKAAVTPENP